MSTDTMLELLRIAAVCSVVYAGIRIDLMKAAMRAEEAHRRLDEHLKMNHERRRTA